MDCAICEAPPLTANNQCAGCNAGSTLSNKTCVCASGFYLETKGVSAGSCIAYECNKGVGPTDCKGCSSSGANRCGSCNSGSILRNFECLNGTVAPPCKVGNGPSDCAVCPNPELTEVTFANQCATCNSGSQRLADSEGRVSCKGYECRTSDQASDCKTCQSPLAGNNQCEECNDGAEKSGTRCIPYDCSTGSDKAECKTCLSQGKRTGPDQCALGHLPHKPTCPAFSC